MKHIKHMKNPAEHYDDIFIIDQKQEHTFFFSLYRDNYLHHTHICVLHKMKNMVAKSSQEKKQLYYN